MRTALELRFLLLLVVVNGLFAMAETAIVAARKARLEQRANAGDAGVQMALELSPHPNRQTARRVGTLSAAREPFRDDRSVLVVRHITPAASLTSPPTRACSLRIRDLNVLTRGHASRRGHSDRVCQGLPGSDRVCQGLHGRLM